MSISSYCSHQESLNIEIKRLNEILTKLRKEKKEVEENISKYLENNNMSAFKYNGKVFSLNQKVSRKTKKKTEKKEQTSDILRKYGIMNANNLVEDIMEAQQGIPIVVNKLNIK